MENAYILSSLIRCGLACSDVRLAIKLPLPGFRYTKDLALELLSNKNVYLKAFGNMMVTG